MRLFAMLAWLVHFTVFLPLCTGVMFEYADPDEDLYRYMDSEFSQEAELLEGLDKIFNFFFSDVERVNVDGLLGIVIVEGQLNMIIQKVYVKSVLFEKILHLQNKCHNLIKLLKKKVKISSSAYEKLYQNVLDTSVWEIDHPFVNGTLSYFPPFNWSIIPDVTLVKRVFYDGKPTGKQSEMCINEIIDLKIAHGNEEHECLPSVECIVIMSQLDISHGYPLTHKLLYIQLARALHCRTYEPKVSESINFLCSRIYQEFRALEEISVKNVMLQDLYLEQMVLCGLEGFAEFLTQTSRENLLLWQSTYGCFGEDMPQLTDRWRYKREISRMKYGCESHITGLAAAAMSINLNFLASTVIHSAESNEQEDFSNVLMFSNVF